MTLSQNTEQPRRLRLPSLQQKVRYQRPLGASTVHILTVNKDRGTLNQGQLTPVSQSSSQHGDSRQSSPRTPGGRARGRTNEYNPPQFPTRSDSAHSPTSSGRRPGGYGGFDQTASAPPEDDFMQRMNNMAPPQPAIDRKAPTSRHMFPQRKDSLDRWDTPVDDRAHQGRPQRQNGYGGFGAPSDKPMARADTFPRLSPSGDVPNRRPSAPGFASERHRPEIMPGHVQRPSTSNGPTSRRPPPRTELIPRHKASGSVDLAAEFGVGNPYHTPSGSASSGYSSTAESASSALTSPDRSLSSRKPSDAYNGIRAMHTAPPSRPDLRVDSSVQNQNRPTIAGPLVESPFSISPRDNFGRPPPPGPGPRGPPQQGGSLPRYPRGPSPNGAPPALRPAPSMRNGSRDAGVASRGDCKACGMSITGKSISSADGRLTGKYHKACFVCTTCSQPFASAEFYVLNDKPYCGRHYHELNGSLCGTCHNGIEGQFVEDERKAKHHVGCFRCLDCGQSLSDGYFEVNGQSYCERDALKRVQGSHHMEQAPPVPALPPQHMHQPQQPAPPPQPIDQSPVQVYPSPPQEHSETLPPPAFGMTSRRPSNSKAPRPGVSLTMERGPYGVPPGTRMQKRMTRIGIM